MSGPRRWPALLRIAGGFRRAIPIRRSAPHTPAHGEAAALYALGMLEGEELSVFEQHLQNCRQCLQLVDLDCEMMAQLVTFVPDGDPPPGFKSRLTARVAMELAAEERAPSLRRTTVGFPGGVRWAGSLAATVCVMLWVGSMFGQQMTLRQVLVSVPMHGEVGSGSSVVIHRSGAAEVELRGLGAPPPGALYAVWLANSDGEYTLLGTYAEGDGTCPLGRSVLGGTLVVTLEPGPARSAPTSEPLLAATIGSP